MKGQEETPKKIQLMKQINHLLCKEFKALAIRLLSELGKIIDEHRENFHKELGNIKRNQSELKNTVTQMKSSLEGMSNRLGDIENA